MDDAEDEELSDEEFAQVWARAKAETELNHRVAEQRPTGSALGRFLDHYLDVVAAVIEGRVTEQVEH